MHKLALITMEKMEAISVKNVLALAHQQEVFVLLVIQVVVNVFWRILLIHVVHVRILFFYMKINV